MVINSTNKLKKVKSTENDESAILRRVGWTCLSGQMEFEQRPTESKGLAMEMSERQVFQARGTARIEALRQACARDIGGTAKSHCSQSKNE